MYTKHSYVPGNYGHNPTFPVASRLKVDGVLQYSGSRINAIVFHCLPFTRSPYEY